MNQYSCEICKDTGYIVFNDGYAYIQKKCTCFERMMAKRRAKISGISEECQRKGFKDFDDRGIASLVDAKGKAQKYYQNFNNDEHNRQNSILLAGQVGSGKTHLGMAICNNLLNVCGVGVIYMAYRNVATEIKQTITDRENYWNAINLYCNARVLYIDDLLKGKTTEADLNILYELINYRYINHKPMVISTEKTPDELIEFDEAVGSRILEMCRGNIILLQGKGLNYRLYS